MPWTPADVPDQAGRRFVITGANSGLGLEATRMLAARGAEVVMACRTVKKAEEAAASIKAKTPNAVLEVMELDLSSLASIAAFASALAQRHSRIDVLMNNAGVMALPFAKTKDGFELQFGTNHLGHFALTAKLLALLEAAPAPRVVSVSSHAHRMGKIDFDNLDGQKGYSKWPAYGQAKLANLLFIFELERWLRKNGKKTIALAAHPGYAATNLQNVGPQLEGSALSSWVMKAGNVLLAQSAEMGALPQVYAAVHPSLKGGEYVGPDGLIEMTGFPRVVSANAAARDEAVAAKLWEVSQRLTQVTFG